MTENRKTIFMIAFATVLSVIALVYGFSKIPSPSQQRELKLDHKRVSDLGELQYALDEYYVNNNLLPTSLSEISTNSYNPSQVLSKTDPQTNVAYEYSVLSPTKYHLCATFITDSMNERYSYDEENYNYSSFSQKFKHPKGRYCFTLDIPANNQNYHPESYSDEPGVTIMTSPQGSSPAAKPLIPPTKR